MLEGWSTFIWKMFQILFEGLFVELFIKLEGEGKLEVIY